MATILVIDDEASVRRALSDLLGAEGFDVVLAEDGREGIELARTHVPDLILCDIMMPGLDGYAVLEELRDDPVVRAIPFIFLTALADRPDERRGMNLGADDYVTKPFTRDDILGTIAARLAKKRRTDRSAAEGLQELRESISLAMPHELRTPLTGIVTAAWMLRDSYDALPRDDAMKLVQIICTGAERLERLVSNYLLYAELEVIASEGVGDLPSKTPVLDPAVFAATAAERRAIAVGRGADFKMDIEPAAVPIAEEHLEKVVFELLDNAFKFSSPGDPVRLTGRKAPDAYTLAFEDSGVGMSADEIAKVGGQMQFERRLHEQQGSGLGLTIAIRIVELYGGRVEIESTPGQGTTITAVLPVPPV